MLWLLSLRSGSCHYCSDKSLAQRGGITNCMWEPSPGRNGRFMGTVHILVATYSYLAFCGVNSSACLYQMEPLEGGIVVSNC